MESQTEIQQKNIKTLIQLAKENPDLRIVPMVDSEVVADDDYAYWTGSWGKPEIDELYIDDERVYFKSADEEGLIDKFYDEYKGDLEYEEDIAAYAEKKVEDLNWEKVIAVNIGTPD